MQKPTVGRKVWMHYAHTLPDGQPHDATVIYVHDNESVNLFVIGYNGETWFEEGVELTSYVDRKAGAASWMPYQEAQARKA